MRYWFVMIYCNTCIYPFLMFSCFSSIDASREDGSFGRIVNDDHKHPNCKMEKIDVNGKPHLCLFALNDIKEGEEITYDYGVEDYPWRTQVCSTASCVQNSSYCCNTLVVFILQKDFCLG